MFDYFKDGFWHGIAYWFYHFQTLITGIMALLAAIMTVYFIRRQIKQKDEHRAKDREANENAARARLSFALHSINNYSLDCMKYVLSFSHETQNLNANDPFYNPSNDGIMPIPVLDSNVVEIISGITKYTDSDKTVILADLLNWLQVVSARIKIFKSDCEALSQELVSYKINRRLYDCITIKRFADRIYDYARFINNEIGDFCDKEVAKNTLTFVVNEVGIKVPLSINNSVNEIIYNEWPPSLFGR